MKIELNYDEISEALIAYVSDQGVDINEKEINVSVNAGRGANSHSASINILPGKTTKKSTKKGKPAKVTSEPEPEVNTDDPVTPLDIKAKPDSKPVTEDDEPDDDKSLFGTS